MMDTIQTQSQSGKKHKFQVLLPIVRFSYSAVRSGHPNHYIYDKWAILNSWITILTCQSVCMLGQWFVNAAMMPMLTFQNELYTIW
jgi:hypothetical protein